MQGRLYPFVSGAAFGIVSLAHFTRAVLGVGVTIGHFDVPVWFSWFGGCGALLLCVWALKQAAARGPAA